MSNINLSSRPVVNGDRDRLARDMWEADGKPERDPHDATTVGYEDYRDDAFRILRAILDAGWTVEVPRGWRTRPRTSLKSLEES